MYESRAPRFPADVRPSRGAKTKAVKTGGPGGQKPPQEPPMHSTPKGDGRYAMGIKFKRLVSEDREALEYLLSMILGEVLKNEDMHIDMGEDAAGIRFYAYEASALLDDIDL